jgi:hypothetical protein
MLRHRVSPFGEPDDRLQRGIQYAVTFIGTETTAFTGSLAFAFAGDDD